MRALTDKGAFSLIELLVAIAVAAIVGGAALAIMLQSLGVWEDGVKRAGDLRAADDFDADFARDFASACPSMGFKGHAGDCAFWTLSIGPGGDAALSRVRYVLGDEGVVAERWRHGDDLEAPGLANRYATRGFSDFSYAGTNVADDAWQKDWDCTTGMPWAVSILCPVPPGRRLYIRRTAP